MRAASLAIFLCLTTPFLAPAQDPMPSPQVEEEAKIVLDAPSKARVGELVRFDVSESVADSFEWLLVPQTQDFEVYDSGRKAVFSARTKGEYQFIVACAKGGTVDVITHKVVIIGPPATPTTNSLTEWIPVWMWEQQLPQDEVLLVADNFEKISNRNDLNKPEDWIKATSELNQETLGDSLDAWKPMLNKIGKALHKRAEEGSLTTPEEHRAAWMEVAEGLRRS